MGKRKKRTHSIINGLSTTLKDNVERMIDDGYTYEEIVQYLKNNNIAISKSSVCRYAQSYNDAVNELKYIHSNFRAISEETDKYPNLDTTEVTSRILSYKFLEYIQDLDLSKLKMEDPTKVINSINGLIKSMAMKTTANLKSKAEKDLAYEKFKEELFTNLRKEKPMLYEELSTYLNQKTEGD